MLKLFKVSYIQNHSSQPIVKFIKATKQSDAVTIGIPYYQNGEEQKLDSIRIECLCEVDEILHCTSTAGK